MSLAEFQVRKTPEEKAQLDPTFLADVNANDHNKIDMSLRLISDEIAGRNNTLDQSVQFLTNAYNQQQQQLETQRNDAINTVNDYITKFGSNAGAALKQIYGQYYVDQLKGFRINVDQVGGIPTLAQTTAGITVTPTLGDTVGNIQGLNSYDTRTSNPTLNRPTRNNNPSDFKWLPRVGDHRSLTAALVSVLASPICLICGPA